LSESSFSKEWKYVPSNKIKFESVKHDIVEVRTYSLYGKKYDILVFNGSFFIQSNAGNIHTLLEKEINHD